MDEDGKINKTEEKITTAALYIVIALLIFGLLIFIHEAGHFICARIFHVPIKEFSIGMGPRAVSYTGKKTGTEYSLRVFPIGGFVSMVGEDEDSLDENALFRKPVWQRFIITAAGSLMNLLIGVIVMSILVMTSQNLPSATIFRFMDETSVSSESGLMEGDTILKVDGTRVFVANDMIYEIMREGTKPVDITVKRNNETIVVEDVSFPTFIEEGIEFASVDFYVYPEEKTVLNMAKHAFVRSASTVKMVWDSLFDLVTGKYSIQHVSGPVGVTEVIGEAASSGVADLVYISVVISMNLGIMNLLPLPALDGGRLIFLIIEGIRRKPVKPEVEGYIHFAGIIVLMAFMILITFKDIAALFQ